jgi:sensor histidine kinase YesM
LNEEVDYLQRYIDLHKIRYQKEVDIRFEKLRGADGVSVAPLLFIVLLENAFKHGVESLREGAYIRASLRTVYKERKVIFEIQNNFDDQDDEGKQGIGLENLKKRLKLLYPSRHKLNIEKEDGVFTVKLELYE